MRIANKYLWQNVYYRHCSRWKDAWAWSSLL